jgi:cytochrome c
MNQRALLAGAALLIAAAGPSIAEPLRGDPARGEKIYDRCMACHSLDRDRTGPHHRGVVGRRVASVSGFNYSPAMRKAGKAGMVWDEATLDKFLENPTKFMPGTHMTYAGIKNAQERADVIAYLKQARTDP